MVHVFRPRLPQHQPPEGVFLFSVAMVLVVAYVCARIDCRRAGDAQGALVILRGMAKAGIPPGEHSLASTMEAFALKGDVDRVLSLVKVGMPYERVPVREFGQGCDRVSDGPISRPVERVSMAAPLWAPLSRSFLACFGAEIFSRVVFRFGLATLHRCSIAEAVASCSIGLLSFGYTHVCFSAFNRRLTATTPLSPPPDKTR